ncbi:DUF892 family protein [Escherichia coli]|uniref:DUF892 family protein n=1 Tax=Escherichia coli TaxID=562 RepID=UPI0021F07C91|nr:DUF892 family protein [Escherichia coli]
MNETIHLLSDTYSAEKQLTRALAKLARATSNEKLSQAFHAHLEETHGQIERIDQIVCVLSEHKTLSVSWSHYQFLLPNNLPQPGYYLAVDL